MVNALVVGIFGVLRDGSTSHCPRFVSRISTTVLTRTTGERRRPQQRAGRTPRSFARTVGCGSASSPHATGHGSTRAVAGLLDCGRLGPSRAARFGQRYICAGRSARRHVEVGCSSLALRGARSGGFAYLSEARDQHRRYRVRSGLQPTAPIGGSPHPSGRTFQSDQSSSSLRLSRRWCRLERERLWSRVRWGTAAHLRTGQRFGPGGSRRDRAA